MGWVALGCYAVYLALAFVLRSVIQLRRTGSTGFKGVSGHPGSLEWWAGILFGAALIIGVLAPVLDVTDVLAPIGAVNGPEQALTRAGRPQRPPGTGPWCPAAGWRDGS